MSECVVSFVVDAVKEYTVKEAVRLAEVGDRIMALNDRLEWLQAFVRDADQKRRSKENPFVAVWVRQTRDVAFQVEDVLDDYFRKTFLAEMEMSWWDACFKFLTQLFILHDLTKRMNKIEKRLIEISKNKDDYNIQSLGEPSSVWTSSSTTNLAAWDNLEEDMIGFEDYQKTLKEQLIGPGRGPRAITSIIGKSGTGKTMLARKVFDCEEVQKHFEIRSWVLLPPKYQVTKILGKIHKKVNIQVSHEKNVESDVGKDISDMLRDKLRPFRYLVVLDGIASIVDWNSIKAALPDVRKGSRVLIIMQSDCEGVENLVDHSLPPLTIEPLDEGLSNTLFLNRVFVKHGKHGKHSYPSWFEETTYGKDVFTLTQGFPLAIVILAGLLRSKESQAEWDSVFQKLKDRKSVKALDRILAMSFDDLPHSLKSCFLYLGALPESKMHDGHKLVRMWISEGFIKPKKGRTLEEIAQQHLKELVSRCLVQLVYKDAQGDVESVVIHNSVHAFVQSEAQEANFFEIHDNVDVIAPSTVRRLSVQNHTDKYVPLNNLFPKLRSLICYFAAKKDNTKVSAPQTNQKHHTLRFFHASKFLRVIDLQGLLLESLPNEIGGMIHLRYLRVKNCGLKQLPTSICNLIYLQTFDVQDTDANNVGEAFWDIPTLRHILAHKIKPPKSMKTKYNLQTLHGVDCASWVPTALGDANDRGIDCTSGVPTVLEEANDRGIDCTSGVPTVLEEANDRGIDCTSGVPTVLEEANDRGIDCTSGVPTVLVEANDRGIDCTSGVPTVLEEANDRGIDCTSYFSTSLGEANNLRSLELEGLSNLHSGALLDALSKLELLVHLKLKCSEKASITSSIFNLSILRRLQSLEIDGKLEGQDSMHSNSSTLPNLTKLILRHSEMCEKFIDKLAEFQSLSCLKLLSSSYLGKTLVFQKNGFKALTELDLSLGNLEEWKIGNLVMPELVRLNFWYCNSMKKIPDGMKNLLKLKEVMVYQSRMIARRIKEQGDDYHKVQHVPIIRVRWKKAN